MKKIVILFFSISCFLSSPAQESSKKNDHLEVVVHTNKNIYPIHPDFFGTNFLYWIDDDSALASGVISSRLKEANMKVLRYPGGTVADNFHWKSGTLENTNMFPYQSGADETDFDEFMRNCKKIGAEPSCVLNTETWAVKNDFTGGAHEAAEWLRYCKKKGYKVKYWEIGNETYWHPVMSANDYARLVNVYADSLKKVDPSVILGVNGHWDINFVGTKERINEGMYPQLMDYRRNIKSRTDYKRYQDFLEGNTELPITKGDTKWWQTVAKICGNNVDMIIVHWYFAPSQLKMVTKKLLEVRNLFSEMYPDKKFLLNMSEYNVTTLTSASYLDLTEMIGRMLEAKTDLSAQWPMRLKYKKPVLLDFDSGNPSILYQIHKKLSTNLKGNLVETVSTDNIPSFSTFNNTSATVVLTGSKIDKPTQVTIKIDGNRQKFNSCSIWRSSGKEFDYKIKEETADVKQGTAVINVLPSEVVVAVFR